MPLSIVAELVVQLVTEALVHVGVGVGKRAMTEVEQSRQREAARQLRLARARADLVVLAAHHDHRVTEAERAELERHLPRCFEKVEVDVEVEVLIENWTDRRRALASPASLATEIETLARELPPRMKRATFDAVVRVLTADQRRRVETSGPFRSKAPGVQCAAIQTFGQALEIDPRQVQRVVSRHGPTVNA